MQAFAFNMAPPATLAYDDVAWCPGSEEPPATALPVVPSAHKMLFVLGSEHTGAEWLSSTLLAHRSYVAPHHPHWCAAGSPLTCSLTCDCVPPVDMGLPCAQAARRGTGSPRSALL